MQEAMPKNEEREFIQRSLSCSQNIACTLQKGDNPNYTQANNIATSTPRLFPFFQTIFRREWEFYECRKFPPSN